MSLLNEMRPRVSRAVEDASHFVGVRRVVTSRGDFVAVTGLTQSLLFSLVALLLLLGVTLALELVLLVFLCKKERSQRLLELQLRSKLTRGERLRLESR